MDYIFLLLYTIASIELIVFLCMLRNEHKRNKQYQIMESEPVLQ